MLSTTSFFLTLLVTLKVTFELANSPPDNIGLRCASRSYDAEEQSQFEQLPTTINSRQH